MALVLGTNCGFVTARPEADPAATAGTMDNHSVAFKATSPAVYNEITEIGWYVDNATEAGNFQVGLYLEDTDMPTTLLGASGDNAKGTDAGWKYASVSIPITPSTVYWISFQMDNTATGTAYNYDGTNGGRVEYKTPSTELTAPWGSSTYDSAYLSIGLYAVVGMAAVTGGYLTGNKYRV